MTSEDLVVLYRPVPARRDEGVEMAGPETGAIAPEAAVVFYDGSLALTGLAAPVAMAVLLAGTATVVRRSAALPAWFGYLSATLAVLGLLTPLSFVLFLAFPFWVAAGSFALLRASRPARASRAGRATTA